MSSNADYERCPDLGVVSMISKNLELPILYHFNTDLTFNIDQSMEKAHWSI